MRIKRKTMAEITQFVQEYREEQQAKHPTDKVFVEIKNVFVRKKGDVVADVVVKRRPIVYAKIEVSER